jgi:formate dehydrogenase beta subunit
VIEDGRLTGMRFEEMEYELEGGHQERARGRGGGDPCDDVILAIGQENAFPGSSATSA